MSNGYNKHRSAIEGARRNDGKFGHVTSIEANLGSLQADTLQLPDGEGDDFREYADGEVVEDLYIHNDNGTYVAQTSKPIWDPAGLLADATGVKYETAKWTLETEEAKVREFLSQHYNADLNIDDEENYRLEFAVELESDELSPQKAVDALYGRTKLVAAHNEQDHGTFGTDNLGSLLADAVGLSTARYTA